MDRARKIVNALLEADEFDPRGWMTANDIEAGQQVKERLLRQGFQDDPESLKLQRGDDFVLIKPYQTPVGRLMVMVHDYYDNEDQWLHVDVRNDDYRNATGAGYWNFKLPVDGTDFWKLVGWLDQKLTTMKDWQDIDNLRVEFRPQMLGHG